jgi:hypothetical protein
VSLGRKGRAVALIFGITLTTMLCLSVTALPVIISAPLSFAFVSAGIFFVVALPRAICGKTRFARIGWWFIGGFLLLLAGMATSAALSILPAPDPWAALESLPAYLQDIIKYGLLLFAVLSTFIGAVTATVTALTALVIAVRRLLKAARGESVKPTVHKS